MPDTKISAMSAASALGGTEKIPVVQSGSNVYATPNQIRAYSAAVDVPITIPTASMFTFDNQGTATVTDTTYGMVVSSPSVASQIRFLRWTNAALPATFVATMRAMPINPFFTTASYPCCMFVRNSANSKIFIAGRYDNNKVVAQTWSNYTTFNANILAPSNFLTDTPYWFQLEVTASNIIWRYSPNGYSWTDLATTAIATYLSAVDQFGIGVMVNTSQVDTVFQSLTVV